MSWRRANSPGWASIDVNQRQQKDGSAFIEAFEEEKKKQPSFPPVSHTVTIQKRPHFAPPVRSFSSVLLPPAATKFPALPHENNKINCAQKSSAAKSTSSSSTQSYASQGFMKIKEIYGWADESLIADVLAAVNNDINEASALLADMVSSGYTELKKDKNVQESKSNIVSLDQKHHGVSNGTSFEDLNCGSEGNLSYANGELGYYEQLSYRDEDSDKAAAVKNFSLVNLNNVPAEPEWEEDDLYFVHRKEALHRMRSASQHSRKASDAYTRGDHFSAQQLSAKAREEWAAAEMLNAKAAKEILSIRNNENDIWKLDLHGLHALEAVHALHERLQKLETLGRSDRSLSPNRRHSRKTTGSSMIRCSSLESLDSKHCEPSSLQQRRPASLHVITGIGNHSRGEAALPTAVRNFLNETDYRYDEARPGLINVRPKFRHKSVGDTLVD